MKLNFALILSIIVAIGLVALVSTIIQSSTEKDNLNNALKARTEQIARDFYVNGLQFIETNNSEKVQHFTDSISRQYNILGIVVYYNSDSIVVSSPSLNPYLNYSLDYISRSINTDTTVDDFFKIKGRRVYQFIRPVNKNAVSGGVVIFYSDAQYIQNMIGSIWMRNFVRWFIQALIISFVIIIIIRWGIFNPMNKILNWVKAARTGNIELLKRKPPAKFLAPLHKEIVNITKAMHEAKAVAEEEAKLRSQSESIWTPERLKIEMQNILDGKKMIVVSNREPYMHIHSGKEIRCIMPASGMVTAMEPVLKACGGLWIASGTGDADKEMVDKNDKLKVPPEEPSYTLRRVWLSKEEEDHFYYGFSNEGLWPLCHIAHTRPTFRKVDWDFYKKVNENFARAVLEETADDEQPFILIQDYHFALLPALIKKEKPLARVALFWHIPWPNPESFGICPWQREILNGMLGADLIGFHTQYHCNHFLETVNNSLESRVLWENFSVNRGGHTTLVKPFPISIAFTMKDYDNAENFKDPNLLQSKYNINAELIGVGVDRIDYTKGIIEKFLAIERFLEKNPAYQGRFTFVQIGAPSRTLIKTYSDMVNAVEKEAERINWKFKTKNWKPILLLKHHHSHEEIAPYYASADMCMVTSLHDGMNLVAKEFVAARTQSDGVLILSRFAGASQEMQGAIIVNPYDIEKTADAIKTSLEMPLEEQQFRMKQMRQSIVGNNIYFWAAKLLRTMAAIH
ncbi:MAG: trehalose-6-phosphate synthase [Bacteroidetes bacterium]|nr:trehalose-6-phosphate synthase [Bacteroidota bacterium]MBS1631496.1 trehalose-6-phosphate synthase [Bacteroidota bacterium]